MSEYAYCNTCGLTCLCHGKGADELYEQIAKISEEKGALVGRLEEAVGLLNEQINLYYICSDRCKKYSQTNIDIWNLECDCGAENWILERNKFLKKYSTDSGVGVKG